MVCSGCWPGLAAVGFAPSPGLEDVGLEDVGLAVGFAPSPGSVVVGLSAGLVVVGLGLSSGLAAATVNVNCCLATFRSWVLPAITTVYTPCGEPAGIFPVAVLPEITGGGMRMALLLTLASMMATAGFAPNVTTIADGTALTVDPGAGVIDFTSSLPVAPPIMGMAATCCIPGLTVAGCPATEITPACVLVEAATAAATGGAPTARETLAAVAKTSVLQ